MVVSDHSPCIPEMKQMGDDKGNFLSAWGGISSLQFGMCNWLPVYSWLLIVWGAWDRHCLKLLKIWDYADYEIFLCTFFLIFAVSTPSPAFTSPTPSSKISFIHPFYTFKHGLNENTFSFAFSIHYYSNLKYLNHMAIHKNTQRQWVNVSTVLP
jgi:hypothetical protein